METYLIIGIVGIILLVVTLATSVLALIGNANLNKKADVILKEQERVGHFYG